MVVFITIQQSVIVIQHYDDICWENFYFSWDHRLEPKLSTSFSSLVCHLRYLKIHFDIEFWPKLSHESIKLQKRKINWIPLWATVLWHLELALLCFINVIVGHLICSSLYMPYILRCHIHFDYFQIELYDAQDPNGCLKMCDCIICIAGILLLTDMKAWRNFEILGFGLQAQSG